jgi:hypothetical protein
MARGFESKDVEFQQAEAERRATDRRALTAEARQTAAELLSIAMSLNRLRNELAGAVRPAHRQMLELAIADLEQQLASARRDHTA